MNIKEIALNVAEQIDDGSGEQYFVDQDGWIVAFAEALVAEIQRQSEHVFAFRRKGLDDFCTCDERRYNELAQKPNLFEVKMFFTFPPDKAQIEQRVAEACAKVCANVDIEYQIEAEKGKLKSIRWNRNMWKSRAAGECSNAINAGDWRKFVKGE